VVGVRGSNGRKLNLSVRVTPKEAEALRAAAAACGVFVSEFILQAALEKIVPKDGRTDRLAVWDVR
jgi:hypothetical protein